MKKLKENQIPIALIGSIANILHERYSNSDITNQFMLCGFSEFPSANSGNNKISRIQIGLSNANDISENPLEVLGGFISGIMEKKPYFNTLDGKETEYEEKDKIRKKLAEHGLSYKLGKIIKNDCILVKTENIEKIDRDFIKEQINKCQTKISDNDFDGAITNARSLCESVLEEIIKLCNIEQYKYDGDLIKMYNSVKKNLNLDPSKHSEDSFKQILSGLNSIICGISGISNTMADRHSIKYKPSKHHAKLIVNTAYIFCEFLLDTCEYQKTKK